MARVGIGLGLLVGSTNGFTTGFTGIGAPRLGRSSTVIASADGELEAKLAQMEAEIARLKMDAQALESSVQQTKPSIPEPAATPMLQEPLTQAFQEPAMQAVPEAVQAVPEAVQAVPEAVQAIPEAAIQAVQEAAVQASQADPTATATLSENVSPLLTLLALSVLPLVLSLAKALKPDLFEVSASDSAAIRSAGDGLGKRDAKELFFSGLDNLSKEPTGWFFGKPSALYSNAKPPPPPTPAPVPVPPAAPSPMPQAMPPPTPETVVSQPPPEAVATSPAPAPDAAPSADRAAAPPAKGGKNRYEKRRGKDNKGKKKKK